MNKEVFEERLVKESKERKKAKKRKRGPYRKSATIPKLKPKKEAF
ncbi:MAG: hypothetical protein ACUVWK_06275 [Nitrososphaerales archaeon]